MHEIFKLYGSLHEEKGTLRWRTTEVGYIRISSIANSMIPICGHEIWNCVSAAEDSCSPCQRSSKVVPDVLKDCGGKQSKKNSYWLAWPSKMKATWSFEISGNIHPTQHDSSRDLNPQVCRCYRYCVLAINKETWFPSVISVYKLYDRE
jgi:hypothetical protein